MMETEIEILTSRQWYFRNHLNNIDEKVTKVLLIIEKTCQIY